MNFDFSRDYVLENNVVKLQPLKVEDVDALIDIANEPEIWKYSFVKGNGRKNLTKYIQSTLNGKSLKKEYPFLVIDKRTDEVAGCTRFCDINLALESTRLGYTWYGRKFQGTGLNKHCKYLLFMFAFETIGFARIGLAAYAENKRSIAAMKSVGCVEEGRYRSALPNLESESRSDAILFSLLKEEWFSDKKQMLEAKIKMYVDS